MPRRRRQTNKSRRFISLLTPILTHYIKEYRAAFFFGQGEREGGRERNWHYPAARKKGINAADLRGPRLSIFRATVREKQLHNVTSAQREQHLKEREAKKAPLVFSEGLGQWTPSRADTLTAKRFDCGTADLGSVYEPVRRGSLRLGRGFGMTSDARTVVS